MKLESWIALVSVTSLCVHGACSSDDDGGGGAGGSTTSSSTTTTYTVPTTSSSTSSTSSTSTACTADLTVLGYPEACNECALPTCCAEAEALIANDTAENILSYFDCESTIPGRCEPECDARICDYNFIVIPDRDGCAACLEEHCCTPYLTCTDSEDCQSCILFRDHDPELCCSGANPTFEAFAACWRTECPQCESYGGMCEGDGGAGGSGGSSGGGGSGG